MRVEEIFISRVLAFTTPYTVGVHFDGDETQTNENSAGFAILFTQKKCSA